MNIIFTSAWAKANHKPDPGADGMEVWTTRDAF